MLEIKEKSNYTGSKETYEDVRQQIISIWGEEEGKIFDPYTNCLTYEKWLANGYKVRKGEKGVIRSTVIIEKKDKDGKVIKRFPRKICLFYYLQVTPLPVK